MIRSLRNAALNLLEGTLQGAATIVGSASGSLFLLAADVQAYAERKSPGGQNVAVRKVNEAPDKRSN